MRLQLRIALGAFLFLVAPAAASAANLVCTAEYAGMAAVPNPTQFQAIIGYPNQCYVGIPCWQYTKGTRSPVGTYPETWYLHVNGQRVHDSQRTYLYVMNPLSGWAQHVAQVCAQQCFIDAMGPSGLGRMKPRPALTTGQWEQEVTAIIKAVVAAGKQALPNSMSTNRAEAQLFLSAAGQGSTEGFSPANASVVALGHVWVTERGDCAAKYAAYQRYAGAGDHFSCFNPPAKPWDFSWLK